MLVYGLDLRRDICREIRRFQPDVVLGTGYEIETPYGFDQADHRAAGLATYRGHGEAVAKGVDTTAMMAELMTRETGVCKGKGGSMHLSEPAVGLVSTNAIVAGHIPMAGGVGLNLQHANIVVNCDLPWNPAVLEQRIGRVHRLGQTQPVRVVNFVAQGTIEEGMLSVLRFKKSLFAGVLDGGETEVFLGGSRLNKFMETVESTTKAIPEAMAEDVTWRWMGVNQWSRTFEH